MKANEFLGEMLGRKGRKIFAIHKVKIEIVSIDRMRWLT